MILYVLFYVYIMHIIRVVCTRYTSFKNFVFLKILKDALEFLNNWERNLIKQIIKDDDFLTKQTSEGLRVTIKSTIDLVNYLHANCDLTYVLTYKFNQDCLEVKYYLSCQFLNTIKIHRYLIFIIHY